MSTQLPDLTNHNNHQPLNASTIKTKTKESRKQLKVTQNQLQIAKMLGNQGLTQRAIAKELGLTETYVSLTKKRLKESTPIECELNQYRNLLRKRMPDKLRVETIGKVMETGSEFAKLKSVEYTDSLLGLSPKMQPQEQQQPEIRPMFYLPAGAEININMGSAPQHIVDRASDNNVIDVTPALSTQSTTDK